MFLKLPFVFFVWQLCARVSPWAAAASSWGPGADIDVLSLPRSVVLLFSHARARYYHGIRLGCDAAELGRLNKNRTASTSGSGGGSGGSGSGSGSYDEGSHGPIPQEAADAELYPVGRIDFHDGPGGRDDDGACEGRSEVLFDWFGSPAVPVRREAQRVSIVFAFAGVGEKFPEEAATAAIATAAAVATADRNAS
jgi:hypothetical protein